MSGIRIDPSEPCAACGVSLATHRGNGRMTISAFPDDKEHVWAMFRKRPTPYVSGGEFPIPLRITERIQ